MTPTLSVEAVQARLICEEEIAVAERFVGIEGAVLSEDGRDGPWTVMVPPVPEMATATLPFPKDPIVLPTEMGTNPLLVGANVAVTTATMPSAIVLEFTSDVKQTVAPGPVLHWIVFPAAVRAGPAATLTDVTSVE